VKNVDVEEEFPDILQNIEFGIMSVYRQNLLLLDYDVEAAVSALITRYRAEAENHEVRQLKLGECASAVYEAVEEMCEWRLGRKAFVPQGSTKELRSKPVALDVILACLKRIRKSIQRWNREGGRQGYLKFVEQFVR
jgi:hypothetical protein